MYIPPDYYDRRYSREETLLVGIVGIVINVVLIFNWPFPYNFIAALWPSMGLAWIWTKLGRDAQKFNSNRWIEFLFAIKHPEHAIWTMYTWLLDMLLTLTNWGPSSSFRDYLEWEYLNEAERRLAQTYGRDCAIFASRAWFKQSVRNTELTGKQLQNLPRTVDLSARTAYACGTTVVTLASGAGVKAAEPRPTNDVEVIAYGWVAGVSKFPEQGNQTNELRHARLRTTVKSPALGLGLFTEVEFAQLQPGQDWLKQYYLTYSAHPTSTINVGRMALAPIWMIPPPFLNETVNYPRLPWSFLAYAVESDVRLGSWRIIADLTGRSGLVFDDPNNFDRLEGALRVQYAVSKKYSVAVTTQASDDFARYGLDFTAKPTKYLDLRGAVYQAHSSLTKTATVSYGNYLYVGARPFTAFPNIEVHGQVDYRQSHEKPTPTPWITTAGIRWLMKDGKFSTTIDYQTVPGSERPQDAGAVYMRFQARF